MKRMKRLFRLYLPFSKAGIKGVLVYKSQTFMWLFISLVEVFFVVFLYQAIYRNSPDGINSTINGFTFYEMVLYMITSFIFSFVVNSSETSWNIFTDIKEGTIANTLTKPVNYRLRHLFTYFGGMLLLFVVMILPILTILYGIFLGLGLVTIDIKLFVLNILLFLILTILAGIINDSISYLIGLLTFYTQHMFGLNMFRNAIQGFLSGAMLPLAYMGTLGIICSYTPFAFLNSTPVLTLMGKISVQNSIIYVGIALLWILIIELINHLLFSHSIKKLTIQGG